LIATPKRITRELDEGGRGDELLLLRALWKAAGGAALARGTEVEWRTAAAPVGGRARAQALLHSLRNEGFVDWQPGGGEGVWLLDRATPVATIPVDWRGLDSRRSRETRKLQQMQRYSYHEGCRRGYVLRYFGDPAAMDECGACDRCMGIAPQTPGRSGSLPAGRLRRSERAPAPAPRTAEPAAPEDAELYARLRALRAELAREAGLPAYCVFPDRTLIEIARRRPASEDAFRAIPGVGPAKLSRYGDAFRRAIGEGAA
jgi:ATP-dependent DNA helicase RecQ